MRLNRSLTRRYEMALATGTSHPNEGTGGLGDLSAIWALMERTIAIKEKAMAILRNHFDESHPHVKISEPCLAIYHRAVDVDAAP